MKAARILMVAGVVAGLASAAPAAARKKALVACIENNNKNPLLDKAFERLAAVQMKAHARKYQAAKIITNCTKSKFVAALKAFRNYATDVTTLVHGSPNTIWMYGNKPMKGREIAALGKVNRNIRAVFQLNCYGATLRDEWRKAGATAVTGAKLINTKVMAYDGFFKSWLRGKSFSGAVRDVNRGKGGLSQRILDVAHKAIKRFGKGACCAKCSGGWLKRKACGVAKKACRAILNRIKKIGGADGACYYTQKIDSTFVNSGRTGTKF